MATGNDRTRSDGAALRAVAESRKQASAAERGSDLDDPDRKRARVACLIATSEARRRRRELGVVAALLDEELVDGAAARVARLRAVWSGQSPMLLGEPEDQAP